MKPSPATPPLMRADVFAPAMLVAPAVQLPLITVAVNVLMVSPAVRRFDQSQVKSSASFGSLSCLA